ncbi:MAG: 30S ribosomal protein S20 [Bdellovibrionota bacterium]|nr:MAG: 30S ribosomal protein S20 [Pseudomonadota bacterium]
MAHHKSAKKRILVNAKKRAQNSAYISTVRTAVKKLRSAAEKGDVQNLSALFESAQSLLHKAASHGMLHRNNASRKVARLAALVKKKTTK